MATRKPFTLIMKELSIIEAIKEGCNTSRGLADKFEVHHRSMQGKLNAIEQDGKITRIMLGQTYVYSVPEE